MTVDIQRLKALAQATAGYRNTIAEWPKTPGGMRMADFIAAANPAAVLELIAEIEQARLIAGLAYNFDGYKAVLDERDQLKAENFDLHATLQAAKGEIERLKAENEALRKDAERYRWMRTRVGIVQGFGNFTPYSHGVEPLSDEESEESDAAIDAAMSKETSHD